MHLSFCVIVSLCFLSLPEIHALPPLWGALKTLLTESPQNITTTNNNNNGGSREHNGSGKSNSIKDENCTKSNSL